MTREVADLKSTRRRVFSVLLFCCLFLSGFSIKTFADAGGSQTITSSVPCTVTLKIGKHGFVTVGGKKYTGETSFYADLGSVLTYTFTPESGYKIAEVNYDGENVTSTAGSGIYNAPALSANVTVIVRFTGQTPSADPSDTNPSDTDPSGTTSSGNSPTTGDKNHPGLLIFFMAVSGAGLICLVNAGRKRGNHE